MLSHFLLILNIISSNSPNIRIYWFSLPSDSTGSGSIVIEFGQWLTGATTDSDSLYSNSSVTSGTSLGTPTSHSSLKGKFLLHQVQAICLQLTFTVTGTDMAGNVITETIMGPTVGNTTTGNKVFKTQSNIVPDTTVGGGSSNCWSCCCNFWLKL